MNYKGSVHSLEGKRGFGFIDHQGDRLFFHKKELNGISLNQLEVGVVLTYKIGQNDKGKCAVGVKLFVDAQEKSSTVNLARLANNVRNHKISNAIKNSGIKNRIRATPKKMRGFLSAGLEITGTKMVHYSKVLKPEHNEEVK